MTNYLLLFCYHFAVNRVSATIGRLRSGIWSGSGPGFKLDASKTKKNYPMIYLLGFICTYYHDHMYNNCTNMQLQCLYNCVH